MEMIHGAGNHAAFMLATGSADQTVIIWQIDLQNQQQPWSQLTTLKVIGSLPYAVGVTCMHPSPTEPKPASQAHEGPVVSLAAQQLTDTSMLLISSAGDSHLCVWHCGLGGGQAWTLRQRLTFGIQLQLGADVTQLPHLPDW